MFQSRTKLTDSLTRGGTAQKSGQKSAQKAADSQKTHDEWSHLQTGAPKFHMASIVPLRRHIRPISSTSMQGKLTSNPKQKAAPQGEPMECTAATTAAMICQSSSITSSGIFRFVLTVCTSSCSSIASSSRITFLAIFDSTSTVV